MKSKVISILMMIVIFVGAAPDSYAKISLRPQSYKQAASKTPMKSSSKAPSVVVRRSAPVVVKSPKSVSVSRAPKSSSIVIHGGKNYYRRNSKYYIKSGVKYVRTVPPFGLRVSLLPMIHTAFIFNNNRYYNADGVLYAPVSGSSDYEVVEPEIGMIIPALPDVNVGEVEIDDKIYFEFDGYLYKQIPTANGLMYEVVGNLSL